MQPNATLHQAVAIRILAKLYEQYPETLSVPDQIKFDDEIKSLCSDDTKLASMLNTTIKHLHDEGVIVGHIQTVSPLSGGYIHFLPEAKIPMRTYKVMQEHDGNCGGVIGECAVEALRSGDSRAISIVADRLLSKLS